MESERIVRADLRWHRPDLWAGYVLVGEGPAVVPRRVSWLLWGALVVAAVLAAVALIAGPFRARWLQPR
ncbi:MAG TPA: hypothetical protein VGQ28_03285 [Thermoanaerobaculia bacterium]|nr:hypothetical protein [Thermoanaerobaculia bacterium]